MRRQPRRTILQSDTLHRPARPPAGPCGARDLQGAERMTLHTLRAALDALPEACTGFVVALGDQHTADRQVRRGVAAQRELAAKGRANKLANPYQKDPAWAQSLIGAARAVAAS